MVVYKIDSDHFSKIFAPYHLYTENQLFVLFTHKDNGKLVDKACLTVKQFVYNIEDKTLPCKKEDIISYIENKHMDGKLSKIDSKTRLYYLCLIAFLFAYYEKRPLYDKNFVASIERMTVETNREFHFYRGHHNYN